MGYTTEFHGRFNTNKPIPPALRAQMEAFSEKRHTEGPEFPSIWCDWVPTADGMGIEWNGSEKFYEYVVWLRVIIARFLEPAGITLSGEIEYMGDRRWADHGVIRVVDGVVERIPASR